MNAMSEAQHVVGASGEAEAPRILVVDDEKDIRELLCFNLEENGYICRCSSTATDALHKLERESVDLAIVDIILPDMSGLEILKTTRFRDKYPRVPILLLSARGEVSDRLLGFELGADDYVVKPFSIRELILRVRSILGRNPSPDENLEKVSLDGVVVEPETHVARVDGVPVDLTPTEFNLLLCLMRNRSRVLSREQLLTKVWNYRFAGPSRTVDTYIQRLRRKLGSKEKLIKTVRGIGYKFTA